MLRLVADLLLDGSDWEVKITVTPDATPDDLSFVVEWQYLQYDPREEAWKPVNENEEPSLLERLGGLWGRMLKYVRTVLTRVMPEFDVDTDQINVFEINGTYVFTHYFDNNEVFDQLRQYYNQSAYRFEVPTKDELDQVDELLDEYFYDLEVVDDVEPFCVVKDKYSEHSDILRNTVVKFERGQHNVFVMKDKLAAEQAVEQGATPLDETDVDIEMLTGSG